MKDEAFKALLLVLVIFGVWTSGYRAGNNAAERHHAELAAQVAARAEEASRRASDALEDASAAITKGDDEMAAIIEEMNNEDSRPDTCAVATDRVLRLDKIR